MKGHSNMRSLAIRGGALALAGLLAATMAVPSAAAPGDGKKNDKRKSALQRAAENQAVLEAGVRIMQTPSTITPGFFSLEVAPEVTSSVPIPAGYHRLWDMKVAWRDVNPEQGTFVWDVLDQRVAQAEASGASPLLVLGLTPKWAAADPSAGDIRWGEGSASVPASNDSWRAYVEAVVDRYGGRIGAYEVWNEANLQTFWAGTPDQMAELTKIAHDVIKSRNPNAVVLAASSTTRLRNPMKKFYGPYLMALEQRGFPFDAFAIHTYPAGNAGPDQRVSDIIHWQEFVVSQLGPTSPILKRPIWDTEVNFGLAGPGPIPPTDFDDVQGATLMARTFADSARLGIDATFWYMYTADFFDLLGVQFNANTPVTANSWNVARSQMLGARVDSCFADTSAVECVLKKADGSWLGMTYSTSGTPEVIPPFAYAAIQSPFDGAPQPCTTGDCVLQTANPYPVWWIFG